MLIATLCVGLVSQWWAMSQTDTNSVATNEPAMNEAVPATQPAGSAAAAETTAVVATNVAVTPVAGTNEFPGATNSTETTGATASNAPAMTATSLENTNEAAAASANPSAAASPTVLPIQFQDVPITTAIENLARLAGINYLLDPKIGYGQPDQNGQIKPEPTISVRWENVSARQALLAMLDNYNLQLVVDPKTKIDRITIRNPNAPPPLITRVVQLKYASVSNMVIAVDSALTDKRSRVVPDTRTSQLIVVATESEQDAVDTLVDQLDKPTRQVLIETRFMEVSSSPSTSKGVDWSGTLQGQNISFGNGTLSGNTTVNTPAPATSTTTTYPGGREVTASTPGNPVSSVLNYALGNGGLSLSTASGFSPSTAFLNADGLKAVLSFLNSDSDAQTIATPRVVTLDNESAHIEVTRAEPIFNTTAGTQGSPGGSQVAYTNLGTILDVTPRISANDYIWLNVAPEVSSDFGTITRIVAGVENQADEYDLRKVTTQVLIPNADTLVMGGFIKDNTANNYTKVPILGDIPVLGYAFRSENKSLEKDNLLIFLTPTIVKDNDFQSSKTGFLQSSPDFLPKPSLRPQSAWDSAKPYDWSNPRETDPYMNVVNQDSQNNTTTPAASPVLESKPSAPIPGY